MRKVFALLFLILITGWGVVPYPRGKKGSFLRFSGSGYAIWKGTEHPEESWEFMKYAVLVSEGIWKRIEFVVSRSKHKNN